MAIGVVSTRTASTTAAMTSAVGKKLYAGSSTHTARTSRPSVPSSTTAARRPSSDMRQWRSSTSPEASVGSAITNAMAALAVAIAFVIALPTDASGDVLDLHWRMSELGRLAAVVLLGTLGLLVLAVWVDEPAYNFFPTALVIAAVVLAVLVLTTPIAIYAALLLGLLV